MKTFKSILLLLLVISFSCKDEKPKTNVDQNNLTANVPHYKCNTVGCESNGSSAAGVCPTCNKPFVHNDAFHANDFLQNGPLNVPKTSSGQNTNPAASTPSPAQNSAGVFHYTCKNGCYGGAGTADKCKVCGNDLEHNQAYHNP